MTWDQLGNLGLTAGQKNVLAQFEAIGRAGSSNFDGVTFAQAKKIINFQRDLMGLAGPAFEAARAMQRQVILVAGKAADDATPDTPL
jgi:hypothetical protein